jgi:transcriptional regulator
MEPGKFESMVKALEGFEVAIDSLRGTRKFNQHKPSDDIDANVRGLTDAGRSDVAEAILRHWPGR